ncbi:hypothetical protein D3C72_1266700 [compost metagenome]
MRARAGLGPHQRGGHGAGPPVRDDALPARGRQPRVPRHRNALRPARARILDRRQQRIGVRVRLHRAALGRALPTRAHHAAPAHQRPADRHRGRPRRDLDRPLRPREAAVPLGPLRPVGREQLVLGARIEQLGRRQLRHHAHAARGPGSDRRFHRRPARPPHHHRPRLQQRPDAAVGAARQRHGQRHPHALQHRRRGQPGQHAALRGPHGRRADPAARRAQPRRGSGSRRDPHHRRHPHHPHQGP